MNRHKIYNAHITLIILYFEIVLVKIINVKALPFLSPKHSVTEKIFCC